jgi:hypothetical protein
MSGRLKRLAHGTVPGADDDNGPLTDHDSALAWETKVDLGRLLDKDDAAGGTGGAGRKGRRLANPQELLRIANARILERCRRHGIVPAHRASRP